VSETGYTTSTGTTSSNSNIVSVSSISNVNTGTEINSSLFPSGTVVSSTNSFVPFNGTYLNASNTVTVTSSTTGLTAGVVVTGAGIPSGTTIQSISGNTVTLSNNTTAQSSGSGSLVQSAYVTLSNTNTSTSTGLNTTSVNFYGSATLSGTVNTTSGSQIALNQEARVVLSSTPTTSVPGNTLVDVAPLSGNQVYIQSTAASGNINVSTPITASTRELMTLGGTISAKSATDGDTVKIMVKVGSTSEPVSYLVKSTDSSLQNIADGLAAAINSDQILQNLGVTAVIDSNSSSMAAPVSLGTTIVFNSTNTSPITYTSSVSATTGKPTETISATQISTGLVTLISGSTGSITSGPVTTSAPLPVTTTASVINAPVISLSSGSGGVGTGTGSNAVSIGGLVSPINYTGAANTVAATAAGTAGAIYLATTGTETLLTSKAGSIFSIQNIAPLTVAAGATISAPSITIQGAATDLPQNPTNANIIINGILGTSTSQVSVSTTDSSTITTSGTGKIVGASVTLSSTAGDIGSSTQNALVTTPSLTISATAGSAYAQDTSAVTLNSSSAGTSLSLLDVSNISAATGGTTLTAPTLILTSSAGSIGTSTASFSINATNLTANAAANVYLADISTSAVTLGTSAAKSGTFQLTTSGDMTTGALTGATIKLISAGALTLGGNLGASTSNITLSAAGLVSQAASTDLLNSASLTVNSSGGDVQLINTNLLNLLSASGGNIDITANNGLNIKGSVVGSSSVDLSTNNSSTGNISIAGNISETGAGGSVTLQSVGAGTISKSIATAVITAPTVTLVTAKTTGTIGSSTAPILTATQALNISSGSSAAVSNTSASALNLGTITTGGALSITDSSPTLNFTQNVTVGISTTVNTNILTVVEKTGNISINSGATVAVNGGKAVIQDLNTSNGTITIDGTLSTQVSATSAAPNGNVTLVIGNTVPTIGTALTTSIPNVTINPTSPGQVLLASGTSASAISGPANTPNATLNATRRNIIISSANAASIILGSNAIVTADPPALTGVSIAANKATLVGGLLSLTNGSTSNTVTGSTASANNSGAYTSQPILQVSAPVLTSLATALSSAPVLFNAATTGSNLSSGPNANASAHASSHNDAQASIDSASTSQDLTDNDEISYSNSNSNIFNSAALNSIDSSKSNSEASPLRGHVSGSGSLFSKTLHNSATRIVTLTNGATMYNPDHDTTLETPFGKVHVGAKAVIIIVLSKNGMSLFNVHDEHRDDVRLEINGSILPISIAEHATIIRDKRDFADLNPLESITHREVNATALPGGMQLIQSQFSILSALSGIKPLRAMAHSSNPEDRKLIQGLVKDAAVIMQTKAGNGAYHRVSSAKQSQKLALAN